MHDASNNNGQTSKMTVQADMHSEAVIVELQALLRQQETERQAAERKMVEARDTVAANEQAIAHIQATIDMYREKHGLPIPKDEQDPVLASEYARMGPTALVKTWAGRHNGEVMVKDLTKVGLKAGVFQKYRNGSSSIYSVLKRGPYEQIKPGHFRQRR